MLESLTLSTFTPLVGTTIRVLPENAPALELTLEKAADLSRGEPPPSDRRAPFSLWLVGPPEPILPQRIYSFDWGPLGRLDIFIVPIGRTNDSKGIRYEAIFN